VPFVIFFIFSFWIGWKGKCNCCAMIFQELIIAKSPVGNSVSHRRNRWKARRNLEDDRWCWSKVRQIWGLVDCGT
jgi:hypothetical protein